MYIFDEAHRAAKSLWELLQVKTQSYERIFYLSQESFVGLEQNLHLVFDSTQLGISFQYPIPFVVNLQIIILVRITLQLSNLIAF